MKNFYGIKSDLTAKKLDTFWVIFKAEYPQLPKMIIKIAFLFQLHINKSTHHDKLKPGSFMRT
jgi:hypothetical protein